MYMLSVSAHRRRLLTVGVGITVIDLITNYRLLGPQTALWAKQLRHKVIGNHYFAIDYDY